jgi:hypothetical protein
MKKKAQSTILFYLKNLSLFCVQGIDPSFYLQPSKVSTNHGLANELSIFTPGNQVSKFQNHQF